MHSLKQNRVRIAAVLVIITGVVLAYLTYNHFNPLPVTTTFKSTHFSFDYPRTYTAREYASGVVSVGTLKDNELSPLTEVTLYQSDPDVQTPGSFDVFVKRQAGALCGSDNALESISCTEVGETPYINPNGEDGLKLNLTLVRKNVKTGTTTSSIYGPFYVFNTTPTPTADTPLRYAAVFVHPSLPAFLNGTTTPALEEQIVSTLKISGGVTRNIK